MQGGQGGGWGPPPPGGFGQPPQHPQYPQHPQHHGQQPYGQQPYGQQYPMQHHVQQPYAIANPYGLVCPRCQAQDVFKPTFTWWGGILGPKLLDHAQCRRCGFGFNAKTGKSNTKGIAIYYGVLFGIVILLTIISAVSR